MQCLEGQAAAVAATPGRGCLPFTALLFDLKMKGFSPMLNEGKNLS